MAVIAGVASGQPKKPRTSVASGQTKNPGASVAPFGLKGDVLGETLPEFRARNDRVIGLGANGKDRAKFAAPDLPSTKHLPQCTNDVVMGNLSWDVQAQWETPEEKRAGVIKCIAALSADDDFDFEDTPTVATIEAYRIVYYFFHDQLYMIKATLPGDKYSEIRSAFATKYGVPSVSVAKYQNSFGATFSGERLLWSNEASQIAIGERDGEPDRPLLADTKDSGAEVRRTTVETEVIGKGYDAYRFAQIYSEVLRQIREQNRRALESPSVQVTIWHNALRNACETAGAAKGREKDL
jgi:hypothetical protein